jgi:lipopolysaccharide export LptBFGC system permease protein LptF
MSEHGFHVHGPHEHQLEHAAQQGDRDRLAGTIAVTTAMLATVGALFSFMGGATQASAALYKNDAAIRKTEASNQWNFYQAKSSKQNLAELASALVVDDQKAATYRSAAERYDQEKAQIKAEAERLEAESERRDQEAEAQMHLHHRWAQATTVLQISIALAAISLLTRRKWLLRGMYGVACLGVAFGVAALLHF